MKRAARWAVKLVPYGSDCSRDPSVGEDVEFRGSGAFSHDQAVLLLERDAVSHDRGHEYGATHHHFSSHFHDDLVAVDFKGQEFRCCGHKHCSLLRRVLGFCSIYFYHINKNKQVFTMVNILNSGSDFFVHARVGVRA